jgi:hypothetical protein
LKCYLNIDKRHSPKKNLGPQPNRTEPSILKKERVRMKRFFGIVLLLFLVTIMTPGCYGMGGGCPEGHCDEEHSPQPPEK